MPGEVSGLRPPAPVLRGGSRIAAVSSPRRAQKSTSRRARHAPRTYIINRKTYPRAGAQPGIVRGPIPAPLAPRYAWSMTHDAIASPNASRKALQQRLFDKPVSCPYARDAHVA